MKSINLSDFLKSEIKPFLFGAFLSRIMEKNICNQKYFYAYTKFRASKAVYSSDFDMISYAQDLANTMNKFSGSYNWEMVVAQKTQTELRFYIKNDLNMTKTMFYVALYQKLMTSNWVISPEQNEQMKEFIRGFIELRGSIDTSAKFIAQDYFYNDNIELKKAQILTDLMNLPINYANFNPRNLQPQYISGENQRNAQFRINLFYYAINIGFMNKYKAKVFENAYHKHNYYSKNDIIYFDIDMPDSNNDDVKFIKYLNFFTNNIYQKSLTAAAIKDLRQRLGFDTKQKSTRNLSIIKLFNEFAEDKCAICGTTTTFENKQTGRQSFEIHHIISYHNGQEYDNIANLVKLCPNCHRMLKKNSAPKDIQIKAIIKILHEHREIYEFTASYLAIDDINDLAEKIWSMLG